jgi:hypothetical protein
MITAENATEESALVVSTPADKQRAPADKGKYTQRSFW